MCGPSDRIIVSVSIAQLHRIGGFVGRCLQAWIILGVRVLLNHSQLAGIQNDIIRHEDNLDVQFVEP
jgi:hypothetical protein